MSTKIDATVTVIGHAGATLAVKKVTEMSDLSDIMVAVRDRNSLIVIDVPEGGKRRYIPGHAVAYLDVEGVDY